MEQFGLNLVKLMFFIIFFINSCWSQKVVKSNLSVGGVSKTLDSGHYISSSLGQNGTVGSINTKKHTVYQGYHGPILKSIKGNTNFTIFPNYFEDHLEIRWEKDINSFVTINIHNITGALLLERKYFVLNRTLLIENLNFSTGTYILILKENEIYSKGIKIIKK